MQPADVITLRSKPMQWCVGGWLVLTLMAGVAARPALAQPGAEEERRFHLAEGYEASGDLVNASRVFKELYDADPRSNTYYTALCRTYMALRRFDELLPIVADRVRRTPNDVQVRVQYGDVLMRNQKSDDAMRQWQAAIDLRPGDPLTYQMVAQSQINNRQLDAAATTFDIGRRTLSDPQMFADQLAQVYGALARYAEASAEYVAILAADPARLGEVMGGMGAYTGTADGADAAIVAVTAYLEQRPTQVPFLELLQWLYTERGDYGAALDVAKRMDAVRKGNGSDLYAFAERALREGKPDAAIAAAEYFRATYPPQNALFANVLLLHARALESRFAARPVRDAAEARDLVERYQAIARDNAAGSVAAEALLQAARLQAGELNDPDAAIRTLESLRKAYPRSPVRLDADMLLADTYVVVGKLDMADTLYVAGFDTGIQDDYGGQHADLSRLRHAELLFYAARFDKALEQFDHLADNSASDVANDALGYQFLIRDNQPEYPDALRRYAAGSLLMRQHRWADAITEFEGVAAMVTEGALGDEANLMRATAQEQLGRFAEASATLLAIVQAHAEGAAADRALFRAAELNEQKLGNRERALELYGRVLAEYPTSSRANAARLRIRALRGDG